MQDVQNLRKAIYECVIPPLYVGAESRFTPFLLVLILVHLDNLSNKLKAEACEKGSAKYTKLFNLAANYLYATSSFENKLLRELTYEKDIDMASSSCSQTTSWNADLASRVRTRSQNGSLSTVRLRSCWVGGHWNRDRLE